MLTIKIFGIMTQKKSPFLLLLVLPGGQGRERQVRGKIKRHRVCVEQRLAAPGDSQWDIAAVFLTELSMELIKLTASCLLEFGLLL